MSDPTFDADSQNVQRPIPYATYSAPVEYRHSGFGIASLIIACINVVLTIVWAVSLGFALRFGTATTVPQSPPTEAFISGGVMCGTAFICLVGVLLGIIGVCTKQRKKAWAIIGISLNAILFLMPIALMVVGAIVG